jgi:hypothetical protein
MFKEKNKGIGNYNFNTKNVSTKIACYYFSVYVTVAGLKSEFPSGVQLSNSCQVPSIKLKTHHF